MRRTFISADPAVLWRAAGGWCMRCNLKTAPNIREVSLVSGICPRLEWNVPVFPMARSSWVPQTSGPYALCHPPTSDAPADMHRIFSQLSSFSDPLHFGPIKVSTNEMTSCVRWGRACWAAPQHWKPFQRLVHNVTHILYNVLHARTVLRQL